MNQIDVMERGTNVEHLTSEGGSQEYRRAAHAKIGANRLGQSQINSVERNEHGV
jgi:hypothetical protein